MCIVAKKTKTSNRSNIVSDSIKTLKMVHTKKKKKILKINNLKYFKNLINLPIFTELQ